MLKFRYSTKFNKDFKRCVKRNYDMQLLLDVLKVLSVPEKLPPNYKDHRLSGQYMGYRECHVKPDWLLIYKIHEDELWLDRTGTHTDLFDI